MVLRRTLSLFIAVLFSALAAFAQLPGGINIDQLSDQQLMQFVQSNNLSGLSEADLEAKAREKGLSADQIQKLKARVAGLNAGTPNAVKPTSPPTEARKPIPYLLPKNSPDSINGLLLFGSEIFTKDNLTFEPNLNIPTPTNYVLGAGDQINVDVFGYSDKTQKYTISADGTIRIPMIGPVKLGGLPIADARNKLISALSRVYPGLRGGNTSLQLTLAQLRSIQVNLIGEITKPGTYTLPSVSTIANALYAAGGPTSIGSYRNIELVRGGKVIARFDLYRYLFNGDLTENKLLQDDDVVRVSAYQTRVEVRGAVKRKAVYEVGANDKLSDVLQFAGGLADSANRRFVKIVRYGLHEQEVVIVDTKELVNFQLQTGDRVYIDTLSKRFNNRVMISGAVNTPGVFSLSTTPDLKALLDKTKLEDDAYLQRALIRRLTADFQPEMVSVDLREVLSGKQNIDLKREDSIHIYRLKDLLPNYTIQVEGEVNTPNTYPFAINLKVQDAVLLAGGFKDGATKKQVEVSRRLRDTTSSSNFSYAKVFTIDIDEQERVDDLNFDLQPFDIIQVRRSPTYRPQGSITIEGEVNFPGLYTIQGAQERISDVIKRAGGLKPGAYPDGALLLRKTFEGESDKNSLVLQSKINTFRASFTDSTKANVADSLLITDLKRVNLDLEKALSMPGSMYDFYLIDGDVLSVPQPLQTIQTFSGVYFPKKILYRSGLTFKRVIKESGGVLPTGQLRRAYVLYPNGKIKSSSSYILFRRYPKMKPGAEVYIPEKKAAKGITSGEIVGFASVLTSLVSMIYLITR